MSRVGKKPVLVPPGVEVSRESLDLKIKGPKGEVRVPMSDVLDVNVEESAVFVVRKAESKQAMAMHGLIRSLIANAVTGVTDGFSKRLNVHGVGFRVEVEGARLTLHIGYSHPVIYDAPDGVQLATEAGSGGSQAGIIVNGNVAIQLPEVQYLKTIDIRDKRKPDPYKGKGVRYENEVIHWKAGKTASS